MKTVDARLALVATWAFRPSNPEACPLLKNYDCAAQHSPHGTESSPINVIPSTVEEPCVSPMVLRNPTIFSLDCEPPLMMTSLIEYSRGPAPQRREKSARHPTDNYFDSCRLEIRSAIPFLNVGLFTVLSP